MDDIWTTNHALKDTLQVLLKTIGSHVLWQPPMPPTDGYSQGHGRCDPDIPTVLVSTLTFLQRSPVLWLRHAEDVNSGDGETTLKQREEAAKRELANLIDIKVGQLKFATGKELKMQFHASKGRVVYFPVGISSSLPTQQATNWNMWAYNELLWIETAGLFQIVSNQKRTWKKLMLAMAVHANHGTQTLAGIVNLSYLSADIIVLIHKDLRLLEADRAIALHHGGSKPQRCHWFGAKRFATTMILTSNRQENNIRFLEQLGKQWQQCSSDIFVYFC